MWECYSNMIPALIKQCSDPDYYEPRSVPPPLDVRKRPNIALAVIPTLSPSSLSGNPCS